ncbi:hypothetical protein D9613_008359 [Agrocybe pediades]|uniref:Uncharacterized protein n=1 Tax=Agrocybe pediades TaxID=84607 RepID=A0A8H4QS56_9AGAR|nr:hypothetical protein D9613_008359 [Agrocybe pediades]
MPPTPSDNDWCFNFRTNIYYDSDSDSSSNEEESTQQKEKPQPLLRPDDLDLSKREEAVTYKPNPFSIAKINAAYRERSSKSKAAAAKDAPVHDTPNFSGGDGTSKSLPTSAKAGQKTIMDGFKAQAMKKSLPTKLKVAHRKSSLKRRVSRPKRKSSAGSVICSIGDEPSVAATTTHHHIEETHAQDMAPSKPNVLEAITEDALAEDMAREKESLLPSIEAGEAPPSTNAAHTSTSFIENNLHSHEYPLNSLDGNTERCYEPVQDHAAFAPRVPSSSGRSAFTSRRPMNQNQNSSFSSPPRPAAYGSNHLQGPYYFSSPIRNSQDASTGRFRPTTNTRRFTPFPRLYETPRKPDGGYGPPSTRRNYKIEQESEDVLPLQAAEAEAKTEPMEYTPLPAENTITTTTRRPMRIQSGNKDRQQFHFKLEAITEQHIHKTPPRNTPAQHRPQTRNSPKASNDEPFSMLVGRKRVIQPQQQQRKPLRNAYETLNEPDENWSTLPARKTKKQKINAPAFPSRPVVTKPFYLPGLLPTGKSNRTAVANTKTDVFSGRRVKMYIPPPPKSIPTLQARSSGKEEDVANINVDSIKHNYPVTRGNVQERRRTWKELWDMLGVESCGVVMKTHDCPDDLAVLLGHQHRAPPNAEIEIVVWP